MEERTDDPQPRPYEPPAVRTLGKLESVTGSTFTGELGPNVNPDHAKA